MPGVTIALKHFGRQLPLLPGFSIRGDRIWRLFIKPSNSCPAKSLIRKWQQPYSVISHRSATEYAAEDVQYLLPAYEKLSERLEALGRLQWAVEDSMDLLDPSLYEISVDDAINRMKGARNLRGPSRAAAAQLAAWRERQAIRRDRPRQWIMRDAVLLEIAARRPDTMKKLADIPGLAARTAARAGNQLLRVLADAENEQSDYEPPQKPDAREKAVLTKMQEQVSATAEELGLATELIAPRKELSLALLGSRDLRIFRGWRLEHVGLKLLEMLADCQDSRTANSRS
jgi:ribonuclease D